MKKLTTSQREELLQILKDRFEKHMNRHQGIKWNDVFTKLNGHSNKMASLFAMETTGGEPDIVEYDALNNQYIFFDCSKESPIGRRSACFDKEAQESRKKYKPAHNAIDLAASMGIDILSQEQYLKLQSLENYDTKTSSWIKTPQDVRKLGGALFADYRYGKVFIYHNGAESYYAARGFRGSLRV